MAEGNVAKIGTTEYESLRAAVSAAQSGDTIEMLADDTTSFAEGGIVIDKALTINGNGKTVKGLSEYADDANVASPSEITDDNVHGFYIKSGDVTIKNLKMTEFGDSDYVNKFGLVPILTSTDYTGTLTLENVDIDKFNRQAICILGGTFSITGGAIDGNATNMGEDYDQFQQGIEIRGGTGTIDGVTVRGGNSNLGYPGIGIVSWSAGDVTVNNVDIDFTGIGIEADYNTVSITGADTLITGTEKALFVEDGGTLNVAAGTYSGAVAVDDNANSSISITGGTFDTDVSGFVASGYAQDPATGKVGTAVTVTFDADGGTPVPDVQVIVKGTKAAKPADPVKGELVFDGWFAEGASDAFDFNTAIEESVTLTAHWGQRVAVDDSGIYYSSFREACHNAGTGGTVTLLMDDTDSGRIGIYRNLTIDFNGHTWTYTGNADSAFHITGGGVYVTLNDSIGTGGAVARNTKVIYADVTSLTINGGTYTTDKWAIQNQSTGKVTINGGVIDGEVRFSNSSATVINGGYFKTEQGNANGIVRRDGLRLVKLVEGPYAGYYALGTPIAAITRDNFTNYFASLRDAVTAASGGDTVELLANDHVSFSAEALELGINKNITIDGRGNTLYGVNDYIYDGVNDHDIYISGNKNITIKDLKITEFGGDAYVNKRTYPIWTGQGFTGTLTLEGVTIDQFNRTAINANGGTVVIDGCTITGDTTGRNPQGEYFQGGIDTLDADVTITSTEVTGMGAYFVDQPESDVASPLQLSGSGSITVNNGVFKATAESGDPSVLKVSGATGTITINGGAFSDGSGNHVASLPNGQHLKKDESDGLFRLANLIVAWAPTPATGLVYNGFEQTGVPAGEGYTITGNTATNAGDYTATATLDEDYVWSDGTFDAKTIPWSIAKADLATADVDTVVKVTYNGQAWEPAVTVKINGVDLAADEYTTSYADNTNVGTAAVTVTAAEGGNCTGSATTQFVILANETPITVEPVADQPYTGTAIEPALAVKAGDKVLTAGTDYEASFINNVQVGAAAFTVTPKNYSGSYLGSFNIYEVAWDLALPYTPGTLTEDGATFAPASLDYATADPSVGRTQDGYWVGFKFIAPAEVAADNIASTTFSDNGGETWASFANASDGTEGGRYVMNAWVPLTEDSVRAAIAEQKPLTWTYKFAWNGNEDIAQTFVITVDPSNITLVKDGEAQVKIVDGNEVFTITFVDEDGTTVLQASDVTKGERPVYTGKTPTKPSASGLVYDFAGWSPALVPVTGEATYTATYSSTRAPVGVELAGSGRYDTAKAIVEEGFANTGSDYVIVACGENFPDALAASSLAGLLDCPVVLTAGNKLSSQAASTIQDLGATNIIIVGGTGVVKPAVEKALKSYGTVTRLAGKDRYATTLAIYEHEGIDAGDWGDTAIIATSAGFADALSIAGYAFDAKAPIFLADPAKGLTADTKEAIQNGGFSQVIIVGGTGVVPGEVGIWAYEECGLSVTRLAGEDRYLTSKAIADFVIANGGTRKNAAIATGANFPDALAGGSFVGNNNTVLLLADPGKTAALDVLKESKDPIFKVYFLGGTGVVPQGVRDVAMTYLYDLVGLVWETN